MLRLNSRNDVFPGGPVSSATGVKEIFGGSRMTSFANVRSIIAGEKIFAGVVATARRLLQHSVTTVFGCGLAGLE